jgi:hypothetical protein
LLRARENCGLIDAQAPCQIGDLDGSYLALIALTDP